MYNNHFAIHLKLTQYCKPKKKTILIKLGDLQIYTHRHRHAHAVAYLSSPQVIHVNHLPDLALYLSSWSYNHKHIHVKVCVCVCGNAHVEGVFLSLLVLQHLCMFAQSCPILSNPTDCSPPGSSLHGISRQEYWSELPLLAPGYLPDPGIKPTSPESPPVASGFFTDRVTCFAEMGSYHMHISASSSLSPSSVS